MHIEDIREYCLGKKSVSESFPFDDKTLVFKVMNKMFLLANTEAIPLRINLKCEPSKALEYRELYESVQPGYHMNKKHWNTVIIDGNVPDEELIDWINQSYDLVVKTLKKSDQLKLKG